MVKILRKYDFEIGMMIPEYMETYKVQIMALYLENYKQIFQRGPNLTQLNYVQSYP